MILFDLIKESILEIQNFYREILLRGSLRVSGRYFYLHKESRSCRYYADNFTMVVYPDEMVVRLFLIGKDQITIDFDDILSNDLEYLVLTHGKILLEKT